MGRRANHHVGVDVHVPGLEVEHVLAPVEFPTAAEAGAVIDDLLVRAELDLGRDSQSGTHRVALVGLVHVLLDRLCPGGTRQDRSRQDGLGGEAVRSAGRTVGTDRVSTCEGQWSTESVNKKLTSNTVAIHNTIK